MNGEQTIYYFAQDFSNITESSVPVYGNALTALFKDYWSAETWITWHKALKATYGLDQANQKFIQAWEKAPFASPTVDFRDSNPLAQYARDNKFYDALFGGLLGAVVKAGNTTVDTAATVIDSAAKGVSDAGDIFKFLTTHLKTIVVVVVIIALAVLYFKYRKGFAL